MDYDELKIGFSYVFLIKGFAWNKPRLVYGKLVQKVPDKFIFKVKDDQYYTCCINVKEEGYLFKIIGSEENKLINILYEYE
jgi:hypothetical protein